MNDNNIQGDLLFGLLALINDFISRDQLVEATDKWLQDPSTPFDEVLIEIGALSEESRDLLKPRVAKHIADHGDNPVASREALSSISTLVDELRDRFATRGYDIEQPTQVLTSKTSVAATGTVSVSMPGADARFHLIRPVGRGGLGIVYEAFDRELNRTVAVKHVRKEYGDLPRQQQQFVLEAEITGGLEHPGIVPVYALGADETGRPFYAMKFIRGAENVPGSQPKKAAGVTLWNRIERFHQEGGISPDRTKELNDLLRHFVDVCNAMEFAHRKGVLHRDLKPRNIMVGQTGETLVVDWGLARPMSDDVEPPEDDEERLRPLSASGTSPEPQGSAVGTYEYMSPEQAAGRLSELGRATDIYSLGAILYCLLTGVPPFSRRDNPDILRQVQEGEFYHPSVANPNVPKPLEYVCLKAMSNDPHDRYGTAKELREEIEQWMAGEPVLAWQEPFLVRFARWRRKHPKLVAGTTAALLAGLMIATVASVLIKQEQLRTQQAQRKAQRNFEVAKTAVDDFYVTAASDVLLNEPRMTDLRQKLMRQGIRYYDDFLQAMSGDDLATRRERAVNYRRLGRIQESLHGKPPVDFDLAKLPAPSPAALTNYQAAKDLQAALLAEFPNDRENRRQLSRTLVAIGRVYDTYTEPLARRYYLNLQQGVPENQPEMIQLRNVMDENYLNAKQAYENAKQHRQQLADQPDATAEDHGLLANVIMNLGELEIATHKDDFSYDDVFALFQQAEQQMTRARTQDAADLQLQIDSGKLDFNRGALDFQQSLIIQPGAANPARFLAGRAQQHFRNTVTQAEAVLKSQPSHRAARELLAQALNALLGCTIQDFQERDELYGRAFQAAYDLVVNYPDSAEYQRLLADTLRKLDNIHAAQGYESGGTEYVRLLNVFVAPDQHGDAAAQPANEDAFARALEVIQSSPRFSLQPKAKALAERSRLRAAVLANGAEPPPAGLAWLRAESLLDVARFDLTENDIEQLKYNSTQAMQLLADAFPTTADQRLTDEIFATFEDGFRSLVPGKEVEFEGRPLGAFLSDQLDKLETAADEQRYADRLAELRRLLEA